jgi:hypothetical protein
MPRASEIAGELRPGLRTLRERAGFRNNSFDSFDQVLVQTLKGVDNHWHDPSFF